MTTTELLSHSPRHLPTESPAYRLTLAADAIDVVAAQRLRYDVFESEGGARTPGPAGVDADRFDDLCDHLVVRYLRAGESGRGEAVATYRLLPPQAHDADPRRHALYSNTEFDLTPIEHLLDRTVEAGRSCVAAAHRGAGPVTLLWGGIADYLRLTGCRYLLGCASISLADGGGTAAAFADRAAAAHQAPPELRCQPWQAFSTLGRHRPVRPVVPPLLRGYLRLGAVVCGPPAIDHHFSTADFLLLLDLESANPRYLRYFIAAGGN